MSVLTGFTAIVPRWRPRVRPVALEEASPQQREALKETPSGTKVSDYVLVLAHDPETLKVRSPLFNTIMYGPGGLSRAERELGALGASVTNHCVYCAAVHASRYNQLTGSQRHVEEIFASGFFADLPERERAILRFAMRLSRTPSEASQDDVAALRRAGLDDAEILDLVLSTALFGWANRLMHTLGDPVPADEA